MKRVGEHTHAADVNAVKACVLLDNKKHDAETSNDTTRNIIRDAVGQQDDDGIAIQANDFSDWIALYYMFLAVCIRSNLVMLFLTGNI